MRGRRDFANSPATRGLGPTWCETGVVTNVNVRNLTIDWVSQYTSKHIQDIQIMAPYLHFSNGEGFTVVPEVGAICVLCFPSDDDSPFVMGFLSAPENASATQVADLTKSAKQADVNDATDLPQAKTTQSSGSTNKKDSDASYRCKRPILNPGDMLWEGRDGNWVVLRRGGVLQIGSTKICQRAYIPLRNYIRDFCENYELNSAAGQLEWITHRKSKDPSGNAATEFTLLTREYAQDKKASIKVSVGGLDESATKVKNVPGGTKTYYNIVIQPQNIDPDKGEVTGKAKYELRIDKAGNSYTLQAGDCSTTIEGDHTFVVEGDQDVTVKGDRTVDVQGDWDETVKGDHTMTGKGSSTEEWDNFKSIKAKFLFLGDKAATDPAVLGVKLVKWLASHVHPAPMVPAVQSGALATVLSSKVFVAQ